MGWRERKKKKNYNEDENEEVDYSSSSTITKFNPPLSLLRIPIQSQSSLLTLAFTSHNSFNSTLKLSRSKLLSQCTSASRIACSLSASRLCQPPFWKHLFRGVTAEDFKQRELCEVKESGACFVKVERECVKFVDDKCLRGFGDAWVVVGDKVCRGSDLLGDGFDGLRNRV